MWSTGAGFFCLLRLGPLCLGIAQRLVDGVELGGVGFGAHHVKGAVLSLGLHDKVGQAVLYPVMKMKPKSILSQMS